MAVPTIPAKIFDVLEEVTMFILGVTDFGRVSSRMSVSLWPMKKGFMVFHTLVATAGGTVGESGQFVHCH